MFRISKLLFTHASKDTFSYDIPQMTFFQNGCKTEEINLGIDLAKVITPQKHTDTRCIITKGLFEVFVIAPDRRR